MAVDVTLSVPEDMMQLARKVAQEAHLPVEAVLLDWIQHPIQDLHELDLATLKTLIPKYNQIQLWTVVYRDLSSEQLKRMNELVSASQSRTLPPVTNQSWMPFYIYRMYICCCAVRHCWNFKNAVSILAQSLIL